MLGSFFLASAMKTKLDIDLIKFAIPEGKSTVLVAVLLMMFENNVVG